MITRNTMRVSFMRLWDPGELEPSGQKPEISKKEMELAHTPIDFKLLTDFGAAGTRFDFHGGKVTRGNTYLPNKG